MGGSQVPAVAAQSCFVGKTSTLSGCEAYSIWSCKPGQKIFELLLFQDDLLNGIVNVFITFQNTFNKIRSFNKSSNMEKLMAKMTS